MLNGASWWTRGRCLELWLGLSDRSSGMVIGASYPEANPWPSFEFCAQDLAVFGRIFPISSPNPIGVGLFEVLDAILLVAEVSEGPAVLVALVLKNLHKPALELGTGCHYQAR